MFGGRVQLAEAMSPDPEVAKLVGDVEGGPGWTELLICFDCATGPVCVAALEELRRKAIERQEAARAATAHVDVVEMLEEAEGEIARAQADGTDAYEPLRGSSAVEHRAHNSVAAGSSPAPAPIAVAKED
jgi:hypothetical protein